MTEDNLLEVGDVLSWTEDSIPNRATIARVTPKLAFIGDEYREYAFIRKVFFWNGINSDNGLGAETYNRPKRRYKVIPKSK